MKLLHVLAVAAMLMGADLAPAKDPAAPQPSEFAWRATLGTPAGVSAARILLPAQAMLQLRSATAQDIRVFNANGEAVATTLVAPPASVAEARHTAAFAALPLFASTGSQQPDKTSVRVQMDAAASQGSVWVQMTTNTAPADAARKPADGTRALPAVLFDTRNEKRSVTALQIEAALPANILVNMALARSSDLVHWSAVAVKGPLFRFEGTDAPGNKTLQLQQPLQLENQYLRLEWEDTAGVNVASAIGRVAQAHQAAPPVSAPLSGMVAEGKHSLIWPIDFAMPLAALHLQTTRANTLVPVRILGRNDTSQAWRPMAQGVVYRIGPAGQEKTNGAIPMNGTTARWLRVEATHGMNLPGTDLAASAEFRPVQLVFLASGPAPFELAVGRPDTAAGMVDASMLRAVVPGPLDALPAATLEPARVQDIARQNQGLMQFMPGSGDQRKLILWLVLAGGVLVLGAVAYSMMRQLPSRPDAPRAGD